MRSCNAKHLCSALSFSFLSVCVFVTMKVGHVVSGPFNILKGVLSQP